MTEDELNLRERQAKEVRDRLRAEFVRLLVNRGPDGFTLAEVSSSAGVSERTLYRYYPNREALIDAVLTEDAARMNEALAERAGDRTNLANTELVTNVFAVFEEHADLVIASALLRAAGLDRSASSRRTDSVRASLAETIPPEALEQVVALFRVLAGSSAWARLREGDLDLDLQEAGYAIQWAMQVIFDEARNADGPLRPDPNWTP